MDKFFAIKVNGIVLFYNNDLVFDHHPFVVVNDKGNVLSNLPFFYSVFVISSKVVLLNVTFSSVLHAYSLLNLHSFDVVIYLLVVNDLFLILIRFF